MQIVAHMADLMAWGVTIAKGDYVWTAAGSDDWTTEVERSSADSRHSIGSSQSGLIADDSIEKLIQGPLPTR